MGVITPNIGIYVPSNGEDFYGSSFASGMQNIDDHDHSGGPNKGVPLSSASIGAGSITRDKLNSNVLSPAGGLSFDINNAIQLNGVLPSLSALGTDGIVVKNGTTALTRSIQGTANKVTVTNSDGIAGDPTISLPSSIDINGVNPTSGNFTISLNGSLRAT